MDSPQRAFRTSQLICLALLAVAGGSLSSCGGGGGGGGILHLPKIAFVSNRYGSDEIYVMDGDGSNQIRLTNDPEDDYQPVWSPDGTKIAYVQGSPPEGIYVMNADGSGNHRISNDPLSVGDGSPAWSPDGTKIAFASTTFTSDDQQAFGIYIMNSDGSGKVLLAQQPHLTTYDNPTWSPDGTKIAFDASDNVGNYQILVVNADGSNLTQLTAVAEQASQPRWSPLGSRIAYISSESGDYQLYVMNADGSNRHRVTNDANADTLPSWSPTAQWIVFTSIINRVREQIYVVGANGGTPVPLTHTQSNESNPSVAPH
ncbi:MAG TPA: hypothetical protein VMI31_06895 [Fimbriimonadaceae bacterium]|nr:hypothetical protein [Fimbriimonadaceae bacterium]